MHTVKLNIQDSAFDKVIYFLNNLPSYVLSPDVLKVIPDAYYDMPTLFEKLIEEKEKAISFPIREYWLDIGQMSDFHKANAEYHGVFN